MSRSPILLFMTGMLVLLLPSGSVLASTCEECHSSSGGNPSGGYSFSPPSPLLVHDLAMPPGSTMRVTLWIDHPSDYSIRDLHAELSVDSPCLVLNSSSVGGDVTDADGREGAEWELLAISEGTASMSVDIGYEVFFRHSGSGSQDTAYYTTSVTSSVTVADLDLVVTPSMVKLQALDQVVEVELRARKDVRGIAVQPSRSLTGIVSMKPPASELSMGETTTISIRSRNLTDTEGYIFIHWEEEDGPKELKVRVVVEERSGTARTTDWLHEIGKYTGIAAFVLLAIGYFIGGTGILKKWANRMFSSAPRRIAFHCGLSYEVLILAVFHLTVLYYGPYRDLIWTWEAVLGELAMVIMIVIAVNGILQKRTIRWLGYQNWRRVHAWGSYLATSLVFIHMIMGGTHFQWLRELVGLS